MMTASNFSLELSNYHQRREREEIVRADTAHDPGVALAHRALAAEHRQRAEAALRDAALLGPG